MNQIIYHITLDAHKGGIQREIEVKRGEVGARYLMIRLEAGGMPYEPSEGTYAQLRAIKPDGTKVYNNCAIEGNMICTVVTSQMAAVVGAVPCELSLVGPEGQILYSPQFEMIVEDHLYEDGGVESADEYTELSRLIAEAHRIFENEALQGPPGPEGPVGPQGPPGPEGKQGERGETGRGLTIFGSFRTFAELSSAITSPEAGDAYSVGTSDPKDIYIFDGVNNMWDNIGPMQGVPGDKGEQGEPGKAATVEVGTVTTGAVGSSASVVNVGTITAAKLNFVIPRGAKGDQGERGDKGDAGSPGPAGADGQAATIQIGTVITGAAGSSAKVTNSGTTSAARLNFTIPRGDKGETGPEGPQGPQGPKGDTGTSLSIKGTYPSLSALSSAVPNPTQGDMYNVGTGAPYTIYMWDDASGWLSQGQLQGAPGEKGEQGEPGENGADGKAATVKVGYVTTGAAGTSASVTNAGTENAAVLDFVIPRGDKGDKGDKGDQGEKGEKGETGATGSPGADGEKGDKGDKGDQGDPGPAGQDGADGQAATIQIGTVTTGAAGSDASVTNAGTANAARLNFVIPRGDKGDKGDKGDQGDPGSPGGKGDKGDKGDPGENGKDFTPLTATALPSSGTALAANTIYSPSAAVGTYQFKAPSSGWAHGTFTTGSSVAVSFSPSSFAGAAPSVEAGKKYEFDVLNGVWAVQEVVSA